MRYFLFLLIIPLFQCQQSESMTYSIDGNKSVVVESIEEFLIDDIIDTTYYTFLETNKNCLIGDIQKIYLWHDIVFILNKNQANSIYAFDLNSGKFLFEVGKKGKGPGEHTFIVDFTVYNNEVIIIDQANRKPLKYDCQSGEFLGYVEGITLPDNGFKNFEVLNETYYFHSGNNGHLYNNSITAINSSTQNILKALPYAAENKCSLAPDLSNIIRFDSVLLATQLFNDTIYKIKNNEVSPFLVVESNIAPSSDDKLMSFQEKEGNQEFYSYLFDHWRVPLKILFNGHDLYMEWGFVEKKKVRMFYDTISDSYKFTKGVRSENGNFMGNVLFLDTENYYSIIGTQNSDLNEVFNRVFDENLSITSNPVLAIHKIKKHYEAL